MRVSQHNFLENFYLYSFFLFFIFNFIDRQVSNIFLIITLILCLISYKNLYEAITNNTLLINSIILFSFFISLLGYYHNAPLHELDNYYRFLLLLPLLLISLSEPRLLTLISVCAAASLMHAIFSDAFYETDISRYSGTSSSAITYANMCATLMMICMYFIIIKGNRSYYVILSAIIFFILFILTGTRGPLIGIIASLTYLIYLLKKNKTSRKNIIAFLSIFFIILVSIMIIPNPLAERIKKINNINLTNPLENIDRSFRERIFYLLYSKEHMKDHLLTGIGPQNVEIKMSQSIKDKNINNIFPRDHVHNEFLDMTLKFGLISLFLLFFVYFRIISTKNQENKALLYILMIMLISSQMTQSQFAHHQAITFFIVLFYIFQGRKVD